MGEPRQGEGSPSGYPGLAREVSRAAARHARLADPLARAVAYGDLLAALAEHIEELAAVRDETLVELLAAQPSLSHRALAPDLRLSRQRVDQLAAIARTGRRRPR